MVNHNVRVTFAVRITDGIATGIWASSVLSTYINVLEGDDDRANERVGYAQAIQGTFLAAAAIPAGWLAITHRRDSILKAMGLVAFAAIATTSAALVLDVPYKYGLLCCGLALWGIAQANGPVLDALFADSVPTGNRSTLYTWLHMCYIVAQGLGPGLGAIMFALHGNVWRLEVLQRVMLVGMALATVPALLMLWFDDDQTLGAESEGLLRVALLREAEEEAWEERFGGGRRGVPGSPACEDPDYRRPFLESWSSDTEREYSQVTTACSPPRPVFPAIAAAVAAGGGRGRGLSYVPPGFAMMPGSGGAAATGAPGKDAAGGTAELQSPGGNAATAAVRPDVDVGSHALLLSSNTASPMTDRSGGTTPRSSSPEPQGVLPRGGGGGAGGGSENGTLAVAVAEAAATRLWRVPGPAQAHGLDGNRGGQGGGQDVRASEAVPATVAAAERFHAMRQAVDDEATAVAAAAAGPSGRMDSVIDERCGSRGRGGGGSSLGQRSSASDGSGSSAGCARGGGGGAAAAGNGAATDGYDSTVGSSREPSLMASESMTSELSFNSLLPPASFKSAQSRPFSRTGSSSSCGSARGGGGGGGGGGRGGDGGCGGSSGGAASPRLALLPYLEEDAAAEGDVRSGSDTPTLDPHVQRSASGRPLVLQSAQPPPASGAAEPSASSGGGGGRSPPPLEPSHGGSFRARYGVSKAAAAVTLRQDREPLSLMQTAVRELGHGPAVAVSASASAVVHDRFAVIRGSGSVGGDVSGGALERGRRQLGLVADIAQDEEQPLLSARHSLDPRKHRFLCLNMAWIPGILALTDCIMGLASGMTIKFFPIFFKDAVRLAPVYVNLMYCAIPLCLSAASYLAQRESRLLGRVQTMVMNRGIGISLLYWIATHSHRWHDQRLMIPIYIARTAIMNSIYPLQKSILMDFVPKEQRAAWNSLESVTSFGWSGSAALGGWLIHKFGFQTTFLITATMQCMGWGMSTLLLPIVPRREADGLQATALARNPTAAADGGCGDRHGSAAVPRRSSSSSPSGCRRGPAQPTASG